MLTLNAADPAADLLRELRILEIIKAGVYAAQVMQPRDLDLPVVNDVAQILHQRMNAVRQELRLTNIIIVDGVAHKVGPRTGRIAA